ncbi:MAG: pilus assembly FimT family protein [Pirellulaceae bacterium]
MSLHFLVRSNPLQRSARVSDPAETPDRRSPEGRGRPAVSRRGEVGRPAPNRRSGFTLMEMLIVIAIMLLLVIATLPRIKYALDESKVRESSRQLNSYFAMAKARAASTGRPCGLWFVTEKLGDPNATPGVFQSTQLYLAEIPPPYSGDVLESRIVISNIAATQVASSSNGPPWLLNFFPAAGSLTTLVAPGEFFLIRFDHKGPIFNGRRGDTSLPSPLNDLTRFFIVGGPTLPPTANGLYDPALNPYAGYQYEIVRNAQRIGAPLALPRGTTVDLTYSGFGNGGTEFYSSLNQVMVLFTPTGRVGNASYSYYDTVSGSYLPVSTEATGGLHFLVGRPEKVGLPLAESNLVDNKALWVSVGRLTGSVTTTENAPNINFVFSSPPTLQERQAYLTIAREYAITQDVRGGQ